MKNTRPTKAATPSDLAFLTLLVFLCSSCIAFGNPSLYHYHLFHMIKMKVYSLISASASSLHNPLGPASDLEPQTVDRVCDWSTYRPRQSLFMHVIRTFRAGRLQPSSARSVQPYGCEPLRTISPFRRRWKDILFCPWQLFEPWVTPKVLSAQL